jgi:choline dehydrogenase-like flavoprotein
MPSATTNGTNGHSNGVNGHCQSALCTVDEFLSQSYDYLIIGGGTAGLCVAARLTEDPDVKVGVLEGGENRLDDKNVLTPSLFPTLPGRPEYDWMMESIPQVSQQILTALGPYLGRSCRRGRANRSSMLIHLG